MMASLQDSSMLGGADSSVRRMRFVDGEVIA